jgi:hypothetical protein
MNSDLVWVIEQRNIFAHRIIVSDMPIDDEHVSTQFLQYKNQIKGFPYYKADFERLMTVIENLTDRFDTEKY